MLRPTLFLAAALMATPLYAQASAPRVAVPGAECLIRVNATPTSWLIQGYDPFDGAVPQGTFSVTFVNEGTGECRFTPTFELDRSAFGLSKGTGRPIGYALLNLTDTQDVTPRAGRTQRNPTQRMITLGANASRTLMYKLVADPDDIRGSGTFTQDVKLEAQDESFRSFGGTRIVLGIDVLPSARIGLAGAYTMNGGYAVVDLGELQPGPAQVQLNLLVASTGSYDVNVTSTNSGRLRLGSSEWYVPYSLAIGGNSLNLLGARTISGASNDGPRRDALPIQFVIGNTADRRAGVYSDVISISVTAR
jgi:hypothetical protein